MKLSSISRREFALLAGTAGATPAALRAAEPLTAQVVAQRIQSELKAMVGCWAGWLRSGRSIDCGEGNCHHRHGDARRLEAGREDECELNLHLRTDLLRPAGCASTAERDAWGAGQLDLALMTLFSRPNRSSSRRMGWWCFACAITGSRAKRTTCRPLLAGFRVGEKSAGQARRHALRNSTAHRRRCGRAHSRASQAEFARGLRVVGRSKAVVRRATLYPARMTPPNDVVTATPKSI